MAVASSAISKNVDFIVDALELRAYFHVILTADEVKQAKPHPEIFEKAAHKFVGIEAAKSAGMKCVAVASTFPAPELRAHTHADLVVQTLEALNLQKLRKLFS